MGVNFPNRVAVEFDTFVNHEYNDPAVPHVGIDIGGNLNSATASSPISFNNGAVWYVWVDYVASSQNLQVRVSSTSAKPLNATISSTVNLFTTTLGFSSTMYLGFGGASGADLETATVLSWQATIADKPNSSSL